MSTTTNMHRPHVIEVEDHSCTTAHACISFRDKTGNILNIWLDEDVYQDLQKTLADFKPTPKSEDTIYG